MSVQLSSSVQFHLRSPLLWDFCPGLYIRIQMGSFPGLGLRPHQGTVSWLLLAAVVPLPLILSGILVLMITGFELGKNMDDFPLSPSSFLSTFKNCES